MSVCLPSTYIFHLLLLVCTIYGYPVDRDTTELKQKLSDEIHYPNGTVVGKYSYMDSEGNPINVKYFADRSSYGVELNSFKVIESSTIKEALQHQPKITIVDSMKPLGPLLDLASEIMSFNDKNVDNGVARANKEVVKVKKIKPSSPDYETFYQNEVKAPKQCEKDKVRVYLVKEKRKIRSALVEDQAADYCEQV